MQIHDRVQEAPVPEDFKSQLGRLVDRYLHIFSDSPGVTHVAQHYIDTGNSCPISSPPHRQSPAKRQIIEDCVQDMLAKGLIEPASTPWSSPVILVTKKDGSGHRLCIDYRKLNEVTRRDVYPLPRIEDILEALHQPRYLSVFDLKSGYWQIPLHPGSRDRAAFITHSGLYRPKVLMFGLTNAPATFMRAMQTLLGDLRHKNVFVYLDDVIVASNTFDEHISTLEELFHRLSEANLTVNVSKTRFCQREAKILGHIVSEHGLQVDPAKVESIVHYPRPKTVKQVRRFLGLTGYYRRFIQNFSRIAAPLSSLLKSGCKFQWTSDCEQAFQTLRDKMLSAPILATPDFRRPFIIHCDASSVGLGAVLLQEIDGVPRVIQYASRTLSNAERKYSTTERETLAILFSVEKFRPYIDGTEFVVRTDHDCLTWLAKQRDPTGRLTRWALKLQQHRMKISYLPGKCNDLADALSRIPDTDTSPTFEPEGGTPQHLLAAITDARSELSTLLAFDTSDIREAQRADPTLANIIQCLHSPPLASGPIPVGFDLSSFRLIDGVLHQQVPSALTADDDGWRIPLPRPLRLKAIQQHHDVPTAGHLGFRKTLSKLQARYFWKGMTRDVAKHVRCCLRCQTTKARNTCQQGLMQSSQLSQPWEVIGLDFMGPFPRSPRGNSQLLVVFDYMTKYVQLFPMKRATARAVAMTLINHVFPVFGVCKTLVSDNGRQFVSNVVKQIARSYNIKQRFTSVYTPQSNQTERMNRTVGQVIASFVDSDHRNWDQGLAQLASAINSSPQDTTGYSPNFLNFGREIRLPQDPLLDPPVPSDPSPSSVQSYAAKISRRVRDAIAGAQFRIQKVQRRSKLRYDQDRRDVQFQPGDLVLKRTHVLSSAPDHVIKKLAPKFDGPFLVARRLSPLTYVLSNPVDHIQLPGTHHVRDLRRFFPQDDHPRQLRSRTVPLPDDDLNSSVDEDVHS